jgi:hypothetical protein
MALSAKRLKLVRTVFAGSLFFFFVLGFGVDLARYFILQRISNSFAALNIPMDEKRIDEVLGTIPLSATQRRFFGTTYDGLPKSFLSVKQVSLETFQWSQNACLSDAVRWAFAALFLGLWLRAERKFRAA